MSRRTPVPIAKPDQSRGAKVKNTLRAPGRDLDDGTRTRMEERFGYDFSRVRIHNDDAAAESAAALHARAYTSANHIVFGPGQYSPHAGSGEQLLAHELTHVVQQSSGPVEGRTQPDGLRVSDHGDRDEQSARHTARKTARMRPSEHPVGPRPLAPAPASGGTIQRDNDAASVIGAIAGVAGVGLAIAALAVAADPPTGAPPTGGITINHLQQLSTGTPDTAGGADVVERPLLRVRVPTRSFADISLFLRTNGTEIVEAYTEEKQVTGFGGGTRGDNLLVNFRGAVTGRQAGAPERAPRTPAGSPAPKEAAILVNGILTKGGETARFRGRYQVFGNGIIRASGNTTSGVAQLTAHADTTTPGGPSGPPYIEVALGSAQAPANQPVTAAPAPVAVPPGGGTPPPTPPRSGGGR